MGTIERYEFFGSIFYLKRDYNSLSPISGNKTWKLHAFYQNEDILENIDTIVSYGSIQSNAMAALSQFAYERGLEFRYYTRIDERLLASAKGNLKIALENGMKLFPIEAFGYQKNCCRLQKVGRSVIVPEGIRTKEAEEGIALLAKEIGEWAGMERVESIILPSGTGTTALYLQKCLPSLQVIAIPCVGGGAYLKEQFRCLEADESFHPTIVEPPKKYRFGRVYKELFEIWNELYEQTGVTFDLLYDPVAFVTIEARGFSNFLYIHQGGLLGNETMIERYKAKFGTIG